MLALILTPPAIAALPFSTTGCEALTQVGSLAFTFNVETAGEAKVKRGWVFRPKTGEVVRTIDGTSVTFPFGRPQGEEQTQADAQFVNDFFWLVPTCHMLWSAGSLRVSEPVLGTLPVRSVGEKPGRANKVTVAFDPDGGGYTPGDAYDLFLDAQGYVVAWTYRRKAVDKPTLSTTFSDYQEVGPVRIATEHVSADGEFRLFFTDVTASP